MPIDPRIQAALTDLGKVAQELDASMTRADEAMFKARDEVGIAYALADRIIAAYTAIANVPDPDPDPDPDPEPPQPPTGPPKVVNLMAAPSTRGKIVLSWHVAGDATLVREQGIGYGVTGFLGFKTPLGAATRTYTFDGLADGTEYTFEVVLQRTDLPANDGWDNAGKATVKATTLPAPVTPPDPDPGTPRPATGHFTVDRGEFVDPDGRRWTANGTNAVGGENTWTWWGFNLHTDGDNFRRVYGMNFARLIHTERGDLAHHPMLQSQGSLDQLCEWARANRFVILLANFDNHPGWDTVNGEYVRHAVDKMGRLARRYQDNPYVWYQPFNEPTEEGYQSADLALWLAYTEPVVAAIRTAAPHAMIVCDDNHYGQGASNQSVGPDSALISGGFQRLAQQYGPNVAGDVHVYARWWDRDRSDDDMRTYFRLLKAMGCPMIVGETGALDSWPQDGLRQGLDRLYRVAAEAEFAHVGVAPWCNGWGEMLSASDHQWASHLGWAQARGFLQQRRMAVPLAPAAEPTEAELAAVRFQQEFKSDPMLLGLRRATRRMAAGPTEAEQAAMSAQRELKGAPMRTPRP